MSRLLALLVLPIGGLIDSFIHRPRGHKRKGAMPKPTPEEPPKASRVRSTPA